MADMEDSRTDKNSADARITQKRDADSMTGADAVDDTRSGGGWPNKRQRMARSSSTGGSRSSSTIGERNQSSETDYSEVQSDKENDTSNTMSRSIRAGSDVSIKFHDSLMESARATAREEIHKDTTEEVNRIYASLPRSSRVKMIDNHINQSDEQLANHHENMRSYLRGTQHIEQSVQDFSDELSSNNQALRFIKAAEGIVKGKIHDKSGYYSQGSLSRTTVLTGNDSRSDIDVNQLKQKLKDFKKSDDYQMRSTDLEDRDRRRTRPGR